MNDIVSLELKLRIETVVLNCILKAQSKWGYEKLNFLPEIKFDTKGKAAGWARFRYEGSHSIDINPILLNENVEYVVNQTVPHEMAHLITYAVFGRVKPHGHEWKFVMRVLGCEPKRCHRLDVTSIQARRRAVSRIVFYCQKCGSRIEITQNRMTKMRDGKVYRHIACGGSINYDLVSEHGFKSI